jgi:hypothetical protein
VWAVDENYVRWAGQAGGETTWGSKLAGGSNKMMQKAQDKKQLAVESKQRQERERLKFSGQK